MLPLSSFIFFLYSSMAIVFIYIPVFFQAKGLSATEIGLLVATGALMSIVAQPLWGYISDKYKTVKKILIITISGVFLLSLGLFQVHSITLIFICMVVFMFFNSSLPPLTDSLTLKYAQEHKKNFGALRSLGEVGVGVASISIGFLIQILGVHHLGTIYGILVAIVLILVFRLQDTKRETPPLTGKALKQLLTKPMFLWFLFMLLLISIPHRMNDSVLSLFMIEMGGAESLIGTAWTVATFSTVPIFALMAYFLRRVHPLILISIAGACYAMRWVLYSLVQAPETLIYLQLFHCVTFPLFFVSAMHFMTQIVPEELRATGTAAFMATFGGLGGIIGSAGGGRVMDLLGAPVAYQLGAILALMASILTIVTYLRIRRASTSVHSAAEVPASSGSS